MKQYYLIPVLEDNIYFNGKTLRSILNLTYPNLVDREIERISILYSHCPDFSMPEHLKRKYILHNIKTSILFDNEKIPYYLIAYGTDKHAREIVTKAKIKPEYPAALSFRNAKLDEINEYYMKTNYEERILNFAEAYKSKQKVYKRKTYN